jgi:hypothetical protein
MRIVTNKEKIIRGTGAMMPVGSAVRKTITAETLPPTASLNDSIILREVLGLWESRKDRVCLEDIL